ncbi:unnamed protein product, partial [Notodromas monacha]
YCTNVTQTCSSISGAKYPRTTNRKSHEKDQTFSRSKQVTSVNVPRLKEWKQLATASESISSSGHTHNGNALDTSTFDYKSEDEKGGESYDANSGANPRTTNRKSRVFDPNEKDRILNNMADNNDSNFHNEDFLMGDSLPS